MASWAEYDPSWPGLPDDDELLLDRLHLDGRDDPQRQPALADLHDDRPEN